MRRCLVLESLEYNSTIKVVGIYHDRCKLTSRTTEVILSSLDYNDTIENVFCDEIDSSSCIQSIIEQNRNKTRCAPKKALRRRLPVYRMLYQEWVQL